MGLAGDKSQATHVLPGRDLKFKVRLSLLVSSSFLSILGSRVVCVVN